MSYKDWKYITEDLKFTMSRFFDAISIPEIHSSELFRGKAPFDRIDHFALVNEILDFISRTQFGKNIRSKNRTAQVNEVLCKRIAYNLTVVMHEMFENGIAPHFTGTEATPPGDPSP